MSPDIKNRIIDDGDIVARSKTEAKRRIQDKLYHSHPNYVVEEMSVWLKDGPQLRTEGTRWFEYNCILVPKGTRKRKYADT